MVTQRSHEKIAHGIADAQLLPSSKVQSEDRTVKVSRFGFTTSDGWDIGGILYQPSPASSSSCPAVLLLAEPGRRLVTTHQETARALAASGFVALSIDLRGSASSHGSKDFEDFSPAELETMQIDVHEALEQLRRLDLVDPDRLAVIAPGFTSDFAVRESLLDVSIGAVVLLSGELKKSTLHAIQSCSRMRLLVLVGANQPKESQRRWSEPYFRSTNRASELLFGMDNGPALLGRPDGLIGRVVGWLSNNVARLAHRTDVEFKSEDGWSLRGLLRTPNGLDDAVPGIVLVHGRNHSAQSWERLPDELSRHGYATLTFDWRGTRKSADAETGVVGVDFAEELKNVHLDVKAAVNFLAATKGVDSHKIALIAATAACNDAMLALIGDTRIRTFVGLTFYRPLPEVVEYLSNNEMPILVVASTEDVRTDGISLAETSKVAYEASSSKKSQFLLYDDAGRGHGMLGAKPELYGMIERWLDEFLSEGSEPSR